MPQTLFLSYAATFEQPLQSQVTPDQASPSPEQPRNWRWKQGPQSSHIIPARSQPNSASHPSLSLPPRSTSPPLQGTRSFLPPSEVFPSSSPSQTSDTKTMKLFPCSWCPSAGPPPIWWCPPYTAQPNEMQVLMQRSLFDLFWFLLLRYYLSNVGKQYKIPRHPLILKHILGKQNQPFWHRVFCSMQFQVWNSTYSTAFILHKMRSWLKAVSQLWKKGTPKAVCSAPCYVKGNKKWADLSAWELGQEDSTWKISNRFPENRKKKYDIKSITVLDFVGFGEGLLGVLAAAVTQAADAQKEQRAFRGNWSGL